AFSKMPSENNDGTYDILMWGTPAGRFGSIKLAKVNETKLLDKDQYRYYAGIENSKPEWVQDQSSAVTVIDAPAGEMSVQYNEFLDRWIITYLRQNPASSEIVLREGENPWGPWSYPRALMSGDMYGPFMHSRYFENRGEQVYFTLSSWSEYNVYLYGITLVKRK
ncbi:MAG: DUF4185 domain-containing protein, partial [Candidatus Bathyarchaeota archaeon]|nr:DUF4185 domain-containing protein [Candidatus Bathyarchaeota archaeon]